MNFISLSENISNIILDKLTSWSPSTGESADETHHHNDDELTPREIEEQWNLSEDHLLQNHGESDNGSNHNSKQAACHNQNECFIEVKQLNSPLSESHCSQNTNLFRLVKQVSGHARGEGEEAENHSDHNNYVENDVQNQLDDLDRLRVIKVVEELN